MAEMVTQHTGMPYVVVRRITRALDFYLALGCDVRSAADGWVINGWVTMRAEGLSFVLSCAPVLASWLTGPPLTALTTADLAAASRRMIALGVTVQPAKGAGRLRVSDPDQHILLVSTGRTAPECTTPRDPSAHRPLVNLR